MTSETERLDTLLRTLLGERPEYSHLHIPATVAEKRNLLRALMNVRPPEPLDEATIHMIDSELAIQRAEKGIMKLSAIPASPKDPRLRLWQGDITRLEVDAIVNAANSQMLGCFVPLHKCIDNAIHSAAGPELRRECNRLMTIQGHPETTGKAKITPGFNLPAKWVIHTVGPIVHSPKPTEEDCRLLSECYLSCMALADEHKLESIAFCCISTGEFHFPNAEAAEIAVATVTAYLQHHPATSLHAIVFNVFKDIDYDIYKTLIG